MENFGTKKYMIIAQIKYLKLNVEQVMQRNMIIRVKFCYLKENFQMGKKWIWKKIL